MRTLTKNRSFWALAVTQFLGAFNDNAFRQFMLLLALYRLPPDILGLDEDKQPLILGLFALPFVLFALLAGSVADRFSKRTICVGMKWAEVVIMTLGTMAFAIAALSPGNEQFLAASVIASMGVLFLMGTQSAFFGPAKYGIIPELVPTPDITRANAFISMSTQIAIILGLITAGQIWIVIENSGAQPYRAGTFFVAIALIGTVASLAIRRGEPADPGRRLDLHLPRTIVREVRFMARDKELFLAVLALSWWWLIGALALPAVNIYGKEVLELEDAGTRLMIPVALGIAAGSLLASVLSGRRVELGLVPVGAFGMAVSFASLVALPADFWATFAALFASGVFGGLYLVPLNAYTQQRPGPEDKGRVMGFAELSTFLFIFLSAAVYHVLANTMKLDPRDIMLAAGILTFVGATVIGSLTPQYFLRFFLWTLTHTLYRIRVLHPERVPAHGGALLVANHISYADPFLIGAGLSRHVRFLMHRDFFAMPVAGWFGRVMQAIPIAPTDSRRALVESLKEASEHAAAGHLVCIFPEGGITRTGNLRPFMKGLETIARRAGVPIVPLYVDRVWGSIFSFKGGQFFFKMPKEIPYRVTIAYGAPLPPETPTHAVRQAVEELSAEAFDDRKAHGVTLATRFLRSARRHRRRWALYDHTGRRLRFRELLTAVLLLRAELRPRLAGESHVGILLPTSNAGAIVNVAMAVLGKVSVNLNYTVGDEAYASAVEQTRLETIITSRQFLERLGKDDDRRHVFVEDLFAEATRTDELRAALLALLPGAVLARLPGVPRDPDQDATIIFSSGTTGSPKGVCLTHHNILSNTRSFTQAFDLRRSDRIVGVLPFFHSFGYTTTLWFPLLNGTMTLYHSNPMESQAIAELLRDERGTVFFSTPSFFQSYLRRFQPEDLATVRILTSGAEKLKPALLAAWRKKFGMPIYEGYGCTELSPGVAVNLPDAIDEEIHHVAYKEGTIGHPLPGMAAKVVDPDTCEELPPGREGLLLIKGPNVMRGYYEQPELTAEVIRDGWYVTGDIGVIDDDGFITITDRLSRFSKIGGEMVPHVRVEAEIQKVVQELLECTPEEGLSGECAEVAVTSIADDKKGEKLAVLHTPLTFPVDRVVEALREGALPRLWIPRQDCFLEVGEIPKLGSGKLDLREVKKLAAAELG